MAADRDKSRELVRTPAGLVPADRTRHVKPGQRVRRNREGALEIEDIEPEKKE